MSEFVDDCPYHDYYPPPGCDVSCPSCECAILRAENARLKSERPYMVDRPYEDLTRLDALRTRIAELEAEVARLGKEHENNP